MKVKQVIVIRRNYYKKDGEKFSPRTGKLMAQAAHASVGALLQRKTYGKGPVGHDPEYHETSYTLKAPISEETYEWLKGNCKKVCLSVDEEEELMELALKARDAGLPYYVVTDAGMTEFDGQPTVTALGIGPAKEYDIDKITSHLKLL